MSTKEHDVKKAEKKEKSEAELYAEDLKYVMSTEKGRRFIWQQLSKAGLFRTSFTGNSTTFFNEGKRAHGLELLADLQEHTPKYYLMMHSEAVKLD